MPNIVSYLVRDRHTYLVSRQTYICYIGLNDTNASYLNGEKRNVTGNMLASRGKHVHGRKAESFKKVLNVHDFIHVTRSWQLKIYAQFPDVRLLSGRIDLTVPGTVVWSFSSDSCTTNKNSKFSRYRKPDVLYDRIDVSSIVSRINVFRIRG
jgi:hypothetical protein